MGLTGKYDFKGIKKHGAAALKVALASTPYTAWLLKAGKLLDLVLELLVNLLANQGLVIFNVGAIVVEGHFDQKAFDKALDDAFKKIELAGGKLTPAQQKAIDDEVIKAARRFILVTKHN